LGNEKFISDVLNVVAVVNELDKEERKTPMELALEDTMREMLDETNRGDTSEPKNIVVHGNLYKRLLMHKGAVLMKGRNATFEDVIIEAFNWVAVYSVFVSKLIRKHPELRATLLEIAKEEEDAPELYAVIDSMCKTIKT
jgi:hypothetical protein